MYGIQCFDSDGNTVDFNFDSVLVAEGVLTLGNQRTGWLPVDQLFPLRTQFRGIFMMPMAHAFTAAVSYEYASPVYWDNGRICWEIPSHPTWDDVPWHGGAFTGRQFLYGYFN
ncbi:TPA: hypothetical protein ACFP4Q_000844 [Neisseria weaveri]